MNMFGDINSVTLLGNITKDPEMKVSQNGLPILRFSVATNHSKKNEAGTFENIPTFHSVTLFGKDADVIYPYLQKGTRVHVIGRINVSNYEKDGEKKSFTEIFASEVRLIDRYKKKEGEAPKEDSTPPSAEGIFKKPGEITLEDIPW